MREDLKLLWTMPWKHKSVFFVIIIGGVWLLLFLDRYQGMSLKEILLYIVLSIASCFDVRFRILPDWIHLSVLLIGIININMCQSLLGLIISPLPFLVMALIHSGSIGGGDIKLIGAVGFSIGFIPTLCTSIIGLVVALLFGFLSYLFQRKGWDQSFPFVPFLQIGYTIILLIL